MATHTITIDGWHPARLNQTEGRHWSVKHKLRKADRAVVAAACVAVPRAAGKRRVSLLIVLGPRQRGPDPDCWWKSLNDALVGCGALRSDDRFGVDLGPVTYGRGPRRSAVITLEDLE